jgi:hypothetical protein
VPFLMSNSIYLRNYETFKKLASAPNMGLRFWS